MAILHRDADATREELDEARLVVGMFADFFDTLREGVVHPDWHHDWPPREYILENYTIHSRSYAERMGVCTAIDVAGGIVEVNYVVQRGGQSEHERWAQVPLEVYTRRPLQGRARTTETVEASWKRVKELARTKPIKLNFNGQIEILPVKFVFPDHLEVRSSFGTSTKTGRIFPLDYAGGRDIENPPYSSSLKLGNIKVATLTQLQIRLSPNDKYYDKVAPTSRYDGSPESPGMVYVLLTRPNPIPGQPDFEALLRIRNYQYYNREGFPDACLWDPEKTIYELEPIEHRLDYAILPGMPGDHSSSRRSSTSAPTASATETNHPSLHTHHGHQSQDPSTFPTEYQFIDQTSGVRARYANHAHPAAHSYLSHHAPYASHPQSNPLHGRLGPGEGSQTAQDHMGGHRGLPSFKTLEDSLRGADPPENSITRRYSLSVRQQGIYRQRFAAQHRSPSHLV